MLLQHRSHGQAYSLTDLGATLGPASYAQGINNQGQVVGYWSTSSGIHAFLYESGTFKDLGFLGGTNSYALTINQSGQVAGFGETEDGLRAFLYQNGELTPLDFLIPSDSGWQLMVAGGINDAGQIVGQGSYQGHIRAFLLTPVSSTNAQAKPRTRAMQRIRMQERNSERVRHTSAGWVIEERPH